MNKINISELNGNMIKREVGLTRVTKSYHNKHVDGSGNFGYFLKSFKGTIFHLRGQYNENGEIIQFNFSKNWGSGFYCMYETVGDVIELIREEVIKADGEIVKPEPKPRRKENTVFDVQMVDGLKVCFQQIDETETYHGMETVTTWKEVKEGMINRLKPIIPKLLKGGFKKVEIGSMAWFSYRRKTKGKFLTFSTMFMGRLLRR